METTYTYVRDHLAELWDKATATCEPVIVKRRGHPDIAIIAADELRSMMATLHLISSPANARWLLQAMEELDRGEGAELSIEELRGKLGVPEE
jgi:antitoxin YefM